MTFLAFLASNIWLTPISLTNQLGHHFLREPSHPQFHPKVRCPPLRAQSLGFPIMAGTPHPHPRLRALEGSDGSGSSPSILSRHREASVDGCWDEDHYNHQGRKYSPHFVSEDKGHKEGM